MGIFKNKGKLIGATLLVLIPFIIYLLFSNGKPDPCKCVNWYNELNDRSKFLRVDRKRDEGLDKCWSFYSKEAKRRGIRTFQCILDDCYDQSYAKNPDDFSVIQE